MHPVHRNLQVPIHEGVGKVEPVLYASNHVDYVLYGVD